LNKEFLPQYRGTMDNADLAAIFYSPHTLEMKKMPPISPQEIKAAFKNDSLEIFTDKTELEKFLKAQNWYQSNLLLMTSGTFGGMNFNEIGSEIALLEVEKVEREVEPVAKKKRGWKLFGKK